MTRFERSCDAIAEVDTIEEFRDYLRSSCSDEELVQWIMRHVEEADWGVTDSARAVMTEALGYLPRGEIVEQVVLNEHDRRKYPGYRRWCVAVLEAREERLVREGSAY